MTTVGRWSPNKVRARVLDGTWVEADDFSPGMGMALITPTSIAFSGTSASIGANGSVEFSACTSLSLNGVFTGDYDNYMIVAGQLSQNDATGRALSLRLRSSGVDSSTGYTVQYLFADSTTLTAARNTLNQAWFGAVQGSGTTQKSGVMGYVYGPYLAQPTAFRTTDAFTASGAYITNYASTHSPSTQYDGFTYLSDAAGVSISGLVSVYGLVGA